MRKKKKGERSTQTGFQTVFIPQQDVNEREREKEKESERDKKHDTKSAI